jgi:hypothetical protein
MATTGDLLVFLDADDRLCPDALAAGLRCLEAHHECAFVAGHFRVISALGALEWEPEQASLGTDPYAALLERNRIGVPATVMYRRSAFEAVGLFDPAIRLCEDYELYLRVARRFPVTSHGSVVAEYRRHGANASSNVGAMLLAALAVLDREWPYARQSRAHRAAYFSGRRFWRRYYGQKVVAQVLSAAERRQWEGAVRGSLFLLRHYPQGLAAATPSGLTKLLKR